MAFHDLPKIDVHSKNADRSELRFKEIFSQHNSFISRPDVPDKGCDFDVELISSESQSSNRRFPTQLKSTTNLVLVDNNQFISYPFETSRLGYLMRRYPSMGLVVIYSLKEDRCFYDYTDKIYERIMNDRDSEDWKSNDTVNIRIPYCNVLDTSSASTIHSVFTKRFEQAQIMQNSHGEKYGLPTVSLNSEFEFDFNNIEHIKRFLTEYGILLLNNYDLDIIYKMISQIPNTEIYNNKDLLLIAAVSYTESGFFADSELFCSRLTQFELDISEDLMLQFIHLKNKLSLGYIDTDDFLRQVRNLNISEADTQSRIVVDINLTRYRLSELISFEKIPDDIATLIETIFQRIADMEGNERTKGILTIWNCENLSYLISTISSATLGQFRMRESLGNVMPLEERQKAALSLISLDERLNKIIVEVNRKASESNDKFIKAYSLAIDVKHFIHQQINYVSFQVPVNQLNDFPKRLTDKVSYALTAYNYFVKLNLYKDAYDSICNALEIVELGEQAYGIKAHHDKEVLYNAKKQAEINLNLKERPIVMVQLISNQKKELIDDGKNGMPIFKNLNDEQLESIAKTTLQSFELSQDRLHHLLNEMKAYRLFHQRCNDENILILQIRDHPEKKEDRYSSPIKFVLRSKKTGLQTAPTSDMELLLTSWGF